MELVGGDVEGPGWLPEAATTVTTAAENWCMDVKMCAYKNMCTENFLYLNIHVCKQTCICELNICTCVLQAFEKTVEWTDEKLLTVSSRFSWEWNTSVNRLKTPVSLATLRLQTTHNASLCKYCSSCYKPHVSESNLMKYSHFSQYVVWSVDSVNQYWTGFRARREKILLICSFERSRHHCAPDVMRRVEGFRSL